MHSAPRKHIASDPDRLRVKPVEKHGKAWGATRLENTYNNPHSHWRVQVQVPMIVLVIATYIKVTGQLVYAKNT